MQWQLIYFYIGIFCIFEGQQFNFFFFFVFLGPHLQHMEVPRLGVELQRSCRPTL